MKKPLFGTLEPSVQYTFSGKSSLALALQYYRGTGKLDDKSAQILVPEWLGTWVYMIMHTQCFPTTVMNDKVRGMLVYHQWGFPQQMEEILLFAKKHNLFVIEDCAHAFESTYKGKRVGTFGDAAVWSLSKFFPTPVGGALTTEDAKLQNFVDAAFQRSDRKLEREAQKDLSRGGAGAERAYAVYHRIFRCPLSARRATKNADEMLGRRRKNFVTLRAALWGKQEESLLTDATVTPFMVPLFAGPANKKIAAALMRAGFESGVYHFDINRNMLKPHFTQCVALPCGDTMSPQQLLRVIDIVRKLR